MKKLLLVLCITLASCMTGDYTDIMRILETDGCTNITLTGYSIYGCSKGDGRSCGFTALKNNRAVEGVVCSGFYKGYTIRYF